jgi:predicted DNA-binding transcriptional regulator AlpA
MSNTVTACRNSNTARSLFGAEASRTSSAKLDQINRGIQGTILQRIDHLLAEVRAHCGSRSAHHAEPPRAIRLPEVLRMLGISRSTLYNRLDPSSPLHDPEMPRPFKMGKGDRAPTAWLYSDIVGYLESRAAARGVH